MKKIVIIGASHAAVDTVAALRKRGWTGSITLVGDEPDLPYQRPPLSKAYYQGDLTNEKLPIRPAAFYDKHEVTLKLGRRVIEIDKQNRAVRLDTEEQLTYDTLILATGTRARVLPVPGIDLPGIHTLRSKRDVDEIRSSVGERARLLIVGAGYIGLEIAASAVKQGHTVTVLEAVDRVLARVTSPEVSEFYQRLHGDEGVELHMNTLVTKFEMTASGLSAVTQDGSTFEFDQAIIGIGVVPNMELAQEAGLECENGIKVNAFAQTSEPNIFAIGDCSYHHNPFYDRWVRLESVPNAVEQAKVAAAKICGEDIVYDQLPWFWSDQYDVKLQTAGLFEGYDDVAIRGDTSERKFAAFYLKDGMLLAVDAINSPAEFMLSKKLIVSRTPVNADQLANPSVSLKSLL